MRKGMRRNYRVRIAVNLLLCAVWLFGLWAYRGYPLLSMEQAFRRLERMEQLPRSSLVLATPEDGRLTGSKGEVLQLGNHYFVGRTGEGVTLAYMATTGVNGHAPWSYPLRQEGPTLVPLAAGPLDRNYGATGIGWENAPDEEHGYYGVSLLLLDVPVQTARIEIRIQELYGWGNLPPLHWRGEGWALGDGLWLLGLQSEQNYAGHSFTGWYWDTPYELRLYDEADHLIYERSGTFSDDL